MSKDASISMKRKYSLKVRIRNDVQVHWPLGKCNLKPLRDITTDLSERLNKRLIIYYKEVKKQNHWSILYVGMSKGKYISVSMRPSKWIPWAFILRTEAMDAQERSEPLLRGHLCKTPPNRYPKYLQWLNSNEYVLLESTMGCIPKQQTRANYWENKTEMNLQGLCCRRR